MRTPLVVLFRNNESLMSMRKVRFDTLLKSPNSAIASAVEGLQAGALDGDERSRGEI